MPKKTDIRKEKKVILTDVELIEKYGTDTPQIPFDTMIGVSLGMKPLWENALGKDWEKIMTREKLRALYEKL